MTNSDQSNHCQSDGMEEIELSPYFQIKKTDYGGRAIFAKTVIDENTLVLTCERPLAHSINTDFKKECCYNCYTYYGDEKSLKYKILECDLWFCSGDCIEEFKSTYQNTKLFEIFQCLKNLYTTTNKNRSFMDDLNDDIMNCDIESDELSKIKQLESGSQFFNKEWDKITKEWIPEIDKVKKLNKKWLKVGLRKVEDHEYTESRYVIQCLINLSLQSYDLKYPYMKQLYDTLQSNEFQVLVDSPKEFLMQLTIFKICYILVTIHYPNPSELPFNTDIFRHIMGTECANSFGIWELDQSVDFENREFLGSSLYPEASYFNHSCLPNINRAREGHSLTFETNKRIEKGEQLCIEYGGLTVYNADGSQRLSFKERQHQLLDKWYFQCLCDVCQSEKLENPKAFSR